MIILLFAHWRDLFYFEVSCSASLKNIDQLQEAIFKTALSHSYMGERVPKSYVTVSEYLKKEQDEKKFKDEIPVLDLSEVFFEILRAACEACAWIAVIVG